MLVCVTEVMRVPAPVATDAGDADAGGTEESVGSFFLFVDALSFCYVGSQVVTLLFASSGRYTFPIFHFQTVLCTAG